MNFWTSMFTIGLIDQDRKIRQQQEEIENLKHEANKKNNSNVKLNQYTEEQIYTMAKTKAETELLYEDVYNNLSQEEKIDIDHIYLFVKQWFINNKKNLFTTDLIFYCFKKNDNINFAYTIIDNVKISIGALQKFFFSIGHDSKRTISIDNNCDFVLIISKHNNEKIKEKLMYPYKELIEGNFEFLRKKYISFSTKKSSSTGQSTRDIFDYILIHDGEDITAQNIADSLGININSVNGTIIGFQKKGLTIREEKNGIKLIKLTDKGRSFNL